MSESVVEKIQKIKEVREELRKVMKKEHAVTLPALTDLNLIPDIAGVFKSMKGIEVFNVEDRRLFIFIILYLYCPHNLFSRNLPRGLRRILAKVLNVKVDNIISRDKKEALCYFTIYKKFREEACCILKVIAEKYQLHI